jgi:hypothetical protein
MLARSASDAYSKTARWRSLLDIAKRVREAVKKCDHDLSAPDTGERRKRDDR